MERRKGITWERRGSGIGAESETAAAPGARRGLRRSRWGLLEFSTIKLHGRRWTGYRRVDPRVARFRRTSLVSSSATWSAPLLMGGYKSGLWESCSSKLSSGLGAQSAVTGAPRMDVSIISSPGASQAEHANQRASEREREREMPVHVRCRSPPSRLLLCRGGDFSSRRTPRELPSLRVHVLRVPMLPLGFIRLCP